MAVKKGASGKTACVVLAAGEGKRMQSSLPKVLHRLAGRTLLEHVIRAARDAGVDRIVAVVSSDTAPFEKLLGASVSYAVQRDRLGTGHALQQAQSALQDFDGELIVLCGDAPLLRGQTIEALIRQHRQEGNACTVLTAEVPEPRDYGRIVRDRKGKVLCIVEEKEANAKQRALREVNSGAYCMGAAKAFAALKQLKKKSALGEFALTDVVAILKKEKACVGAFKVCDPDEIMGINSRVALAQAEKVLQRRIAQRHMENGVSIVDPANTYIGCDVEIERDSVIEPFSVLEGRVRVGKGCTVGPFAHLRDGAVLEDAAEVGNFVEVKKSVIGQGSKAKHLTYLGDATLGRKVNIGAGTITANYDGKNKHATRIDDGAHIGSNTTLVAPVSVGKNAVTGAGCVVTRNHHVPDGAVVAGVPARVLAKTNGGNK